MSYEEARARAHARWVAERHDAIEALEASIAKLEGELAAGNGIDHYVDQAGFHSWHSKEADLNLFRYVHARLIAAEEQDTP